MRALVNAALGLWLGCTGMALGQGAANPVVVELYTSQGCSSCPPADAILRDMAGREDVIALGLHVDYWDYIGWKDVFADPAFTKRQKSYARAAGARSVYTPQMVIQGQDHLVGTRPGELAQLIARHAAQGQSVRLRLERAGDTVRINAPEPRPPLGRKVTVQLVRYSPEQAVDIQRGENAGRRISYTNIVTLWETLGEWDGATPLAMTARAAGSDPVVVILQDRGPGAILAAARLR